MTHIAFLGLGRQQQKGRDRPKVILPRESGMPATVNLDDYPHCQRIDEWHASFILPLGLSLTTHVSACDSDSERSIMSTAVKLPCYCATLRQATRALTTLYDKHLSATGLKATQFSILQALDYMGQARNRDLEGALTIDQTTLTRNLAILAREGLITVVGRPSGREKAWGLTAAGSELMTKAKPLWEQAQAEIRSRMGAQRTRALHSDVFELVSAIT
jgi:DNA-binding MarR family transcriptional regulator